MALPESPFCSFKLSAKQCSVISEIRRSTAMRAIFGSPAISKSPFHAYRPFATSLGVVSFNQMKKTTAEYSIPQETKQAWRELLEIGKAREQQIYGHVPKHVSADDEQIHGSYVNLDDVISRMNVMSSCDPLAPKTIRNFNKIRAGYRCFYDSLKHRDIVVLGGEVIFRNRHAARGYSIRINFPMGYKQHDASTALAQGIKKLREINVVLSATKASLETGFAINLRHVYYCNEVKLATDMLRAAREACANFVGVSVGTLPIVPQPGSIMTGSLEYCALNGRITSAKTDKFVDVPTAIDDLPLYSDEERLVVVTAETEPVAKGVAVALQQIAFTSSIVSATKGMADFPIRHLERILTPLNERPETMSKFLLHIPDQNPSGVNIHVVLCGGNLANTDSFAPLRLINIRPIGDIYVASRVTGMSMFQLKNDEQFCANFRPIDRNIMDFMDAYATEDCAATVATRRDESVLLRNLRKLDFVAANASISSWIDTLLKENMSCQAEIFNKLKPGTIEDLVLEALPTKEERRTAAKTVLCSKETFLRIASGLKMLCESQKKFLIEADTITISPQDLHKCFQLQLLPDVVNEQFVFPDDTSKCYIFKLESLVRLPANKTVEADSYVVLQSQTLFLLSVIGSQLQIEEIVFLSACYWNSELTTIRKKEETVFIQLMDKLGPFSFRAKFAANKYTGDINATAFVQYLEERRQMQMRDLSGRTFWDEECDSICEDFIRRLKELWERSQTDPAFLNRTVSCRLCNARIGYASEKDIRSDIAAHVMDNHAESVIPHLVDIFCSLCSDKPFFRTKAEFRAHLRKFHSDITTRTRIGILADTPNVASDTCDLLSFCMIG